ncbi:uncharacterized protein LOC142664933 [Rhinoderma darwinii]|uniref:uncharacterized protein LOC142664933 n=1 Tax=Rhinoderma darwinii TaxID=43563 RepID=UPI003F66FE34
MSYRELLQLAIDESSRINQGIADGRLRSGHRRRQSVEQDEDHDNVPDRRRRRGQVPPRRRLQQEGADRSRSPLRPEPIEQSETTSGRRINSETELRIPGESQPGSTPSSTQERSERLEEPTQDPSTSEPLPNLQPSREGSRSPQQTSNRLVEPTPSTSQLLPNQQSTTETTDSRPVQRRQRRRGRRGRQIDRLPSRNFTENEDIQSCTICLEDYEIGEQVTVLPCSHLFHLPCIAHWIPTNPRCPLCRVHAFQRKRRR